MQGAGFAVLARSTHGAGGEVELVVGGAFCDVELEGGRVSISSMFIGVGELSRTVRA